MLLMRPHVIVSGIGLGFELGGIQEKQLVEQGKGRRGQYSAWRADEEVCSVPTWREARATSARDTKTALSVRNDSKITRLDSRHIKSTALVTSACGRRSPIPQVFVAVR